MFIVTLPDMSGEFGLSPAQASWAITGYAVVLAIGSITYGKLADIFPARKLIVIGLFLFSTGSLIGYFSTHFQLLMAARLLQAGGGAAMVTIPLILARRFIPTDQLGKALGSFTAASACAAAFGPVVSGTISSILNWHYIFLLPAIAILMIPAYLRTIPLGKNHHRDFDFKGAIILGSALAALLLVISKEMFLALPAAIILFLLFIYHIHRSANPFIEPRLFHYRTYRRLLLVNSLVHATAMSMFFQVPFILRNHYNLETQEIGMIIFPGASFSAVLGYAAGRLSDKGFNLAVSYGGLILLATCYLLPGQWVGVSTHLITWSLVLGYSGFAFINISMGKTVSLSLPHNIIGTGMGIYKLTLIISGALGTALTAKWMEVASTPILHSSLNPSKDPIHGSLFFLMVIVVMFAGLFMKRTSPPGQHSGNPNASDV